jgi:Iap family predicted aminopeptidase
MHGGFYHSPLDVQVDVANVLYAAELAKRVARLKPPTPAVRLEDYGFPPVDDPYVAWSLVYNYLVVFKDFRHSDIVYTNVYRFLKRGVGSTAG